MRPRQLAASGIIRAHSLTNAVPRQRSAHPRAIGRALHDGASTSADSPRFSVPVTASARCFVTFAPPATIESTRTLLEDESGRHANLNDYPHLPVFIWDGFAAEPVCCGSEELRALVRDVTQRNGIPQVRIGPSTGTSDMRHFAKRGIPCLLYGPGRGFNPHRPDEHYLLDDLPFMMKVYLDMIVTWCNASSSRS
jgi:acetylornithine deacetylase/succinyl-diaminopimelate desuccinylase-like protein